MRDLPTFIAPTVFLLGGAFIIAIAGDAKSSGFENCSDAFVNGIAPKYETDKNNNIVNLCKGSVLTHGVSFAVAFNKNRRTADFAAYKLTRAMVDAPSTFKRNNNWFAPDRDIAANNGEKAQATNGTYKHSGLDRGHLIKAEDMKLSKGVYKSTFLYSSIVPQFPNINRIAWRKVEEIPREKIKNGIFDEVWIISGVIGTHPTKQDLDVVVPACFYRIMIGKKEGVYSVAALIVPNNNDIDNKTPIEKLSTSYSAIKRAANIDLLFGFNEMDWTNIGIDSGKWGLRPTTATNNEITSCG